mmetsp:Transcript_22332/g.62283  ORF Transcript_22332/g.62283 Transcript_22332/m.62283 type:complete len:91 (+) Transcript_22332:306-578(+)
MKSTKRHHQHGGDSHNVRQQRRATNRGWLDLTELPRLARSAAVAIAPSVSGWANFSAVITALRLCGRLFALCGDTQSVIFGGIPSKLILG